MTKLNQTLVIVLLIQLGIFAAANLFESDPHSFQRKKLFSDLSADAVVSVTIADHDGNQVELVRTAEQFVLASHANYPTDADKVEEFIGKLPGLAATQLVTTQQTHHRSLEVDETSFQRKITVKMPQRTYSFLLGSSPGIKSVHLRFNDSNDVYLVKGLSTWDVGTTPTTWVDSQYFKVDKERVVALTLANKHNTLSLRKGGDGKWQLDPSPAGKALKQSAIDAFINSASSVYMQAPVSRTAEAKHGLAEPAAKVTLKLALKQEKRHSSTTQDADPGISTEADLAGATTDSVQDSAPEATTTLPIDAESADAPAAFETVTLSIGNVYQQDDTRQYFAKSDQSDYVVLIGSWAAEQLTDKKLADLVEEDEQS